jgi:hypothetical protein
MGDVVQMARPTADAAWGGDDEYVGAQHRSCCAMEDTEA